MIYGPVCTCSYTAVVKNQDAKKMKYEGEGVQKSNILMKATHKKLNTRELFQKMHEKSPILRIRRSVARTSSLPLSHLCLLRWSL